MIRSFSPDPLNYVRLTISITLDYGISARGKIGTLCVGVTKDWLESF